MACKVLTVPEPVTVSIAVLTELVACKVLTVPEPTTVSVVVFTEELACNVFTVPEPTTVSVVVFTELLACNVFVIVLDATSKLVPTDNDCPIAPAFETFNILPLILFVSVILLPLISLVTAR